MFIRRARRAIVVLLVPALAAPAIAAFADVKDLHPALLRRSDVPASFTHSKVTIVPRFAQYLHAEYVSSGSTPITHDSVCVAPPSVARDGGIQTVSQTFFGRN